MTKQISPAELAVGQFVTVLENKPFEVPSIGLFSEAVTTVVSIDRSGMGDIHTVMAVQLPYVVLRREGKMKEDFSHTYDTRRTTLMELTPEFVKATIPRLVP